MIIWSRFHCRMQEYLKAEKCMIDKGFQLTSDGVLRRIYKNLSYFWRLFLCLGALNCQYRLALKPWKRQKGLPKRPDRFHGNEIKQSETEEGNSNPFDIGLSEDQQNQSELDSALRRLVKDLEQAMQEAKEGISANRDGTYLVKRGDYLDKIIRTTVGNYPFKRDILRKAFVQSNPKVFRRSNPNWMYANKTMRIPGVEDIKRVIFKDQPDNKSSAKNPYEGWVRYP